jgi:two-component system, LytTR family, response regulator
MKVKCIAIDDEPLALEQMVRYIEKTPFLELLGTFPSALKAMEGQVLNQSELLYLDINMPDLSGMDFSKHISKDKKIIFTTAYEQYALEGFKVDALDYLLKPFNYDEFLMASLKAQHHFELVSTSKPNDDFMFVKSDYQSIRINYVDILYIESMKDYIKIYKKNQAKPVLTLMTIKSMEERLPTKEFMRVHRSFIVQLSAISSVDGNTIIINNQVIPIGDSYRKHFKEYMN